MMNELKKTLKELELHRDEVLEKIQEQYNAIFRDSSAIKDGLKLLESSTDYQQDELGIGRWARVDLSMFNDCIDELNEYLMNLDDHAFGCTYDAKNRALCELGDPECITIDYEGDVCIDGNLIIGGHEYKSVTQRNKKIKEYMDKEGHYPGVFSVGRYGDVTFVDVYKE